MRISLSLFLSFFFLITAEAQLPKTYSSSAIFEQIKKLDVLGSVLYIAAHPDDENTRLLAYLSKGKLFRTGYLSMTRGDGGQNLIGDEQGVALGLIRTQELLAARRIDGAEQFFTRAYDFGYTKSPKETFQFWGKQKILSDVVWVIRKFRPDIIITRFPATGEGGHGHHTASAILAFEAFDAAADSTKFVEQFQYGVRPWQAKRILWNTFNFGNTNTTNEDQLKIDVGGYNALLGKSLGEIAAESRSQHKSQGFGVPASRGKQLEYFKTIKGTKPDSLLMDGVVTDWKRLNENALQAAIKNAIKDYSFQHPEKSLPQLLNIYQYLKKSGSDYWHRQKLKEVKQIMKECVGLYIEATTNTKFAVQGDSLEINLNIDNRLGNNINLSSIKIRGTNFIINKKLPKNQTVSRTVSVFIPKDAKISEPYWLQEEKTKGSFVIKEQTMIGKAENEPERAIFAISFDGEPVTYQVPIQYKTNDAVMGESYQPLFIIPKVEIKSEPAIALSVNNEPVEVGVSIIENGSETNTVPIKKLVSNNVNKYGNGDSMLYSIKDVTKSDVEMLRWSAMLPHQHFDSYKKLIQYPHIPTIIYFPKAETKLVSIDLKVAGKKAGYIPGAGDKIPIALEKMGYAVVVLSKEEITPNNLAQFDVIVSGVRAYNIHEWLNGSYTVLMNYVKSGGVLFVQYNTNNRIARVKAKIGPYPFTISRARVTDENAAVNFLRPDDTLLNYPNIISQNDFKNWIQERSTYHAENYETHYKALLGMKDAAGIEEDGSLIYTDYGKGRFIYSGLVFFRELPAGVAGAYRLFANLIAAPQN